MPANRKQLVFRLDTVIFATDLSSASHNAGLYASAISMRFSANLLIAHAFTLIQAALEVEIQKKISSQQRLHLNQDLKLAAEVLVSGRGKTESLLLEGDPCNVIPELAQRRSPSLVVLGTHGKGSIDRFVLGSAAERILRHSTGPTLTVGPNVKILHAGVLNIRRILFATDCSPRAANAAPIAIALAEAFSADLDVLNVVRSSDVDHPEQSHLLQRTLYGAVDAIMPHGAGQVCRPHTFVTLGKPHNDILKHTDEREIDLLILGLHRNTHLGMQIRTSGAFPIIIKARCPVITVAYGSASNL